MLILGILPLESGDVIIACAISAIHHNLLFPCVPFINLFQDLPLRSLHTSNFMYMLQDQRMEYDKIIGVP